MKTSTRKDILAYIRKHHEVTAKQLSETFSITPQALFRHLKKLLEEKKITKIGSPPRVFYLPAQEAAPVANLFELDPKSLRTIEESFLLITPAGERFEGLPGFVHWCQSHNKQFIRAAHEYVDAISRQDTYRENGLIDGMPKLRTTFIELFLDELYYLDFYNIEGFTTTKLGTLLLYGKQGQNRTLIKELYEMVKDRILTLVNDMEIDAVGFIPPTVHRNIQLQKELERMLHLDLPHISFVKPAAKVAVPQKILRTLDERVENAKRSIIVKPAKSYENILLIDDAVGSGATLNETARKLKERGFASGKIIGLALTGSFKGFDVVSEV